MEQQDSPKNRFTVRVLPWIVAAGALILYLITLNRWLSWASLGTVAKIANWDWWTPTLQAPLYHLLTWPVRSVPPAWQALALNIFSALCGAGALGLLARSVALLPQDRTREQRQRVQDDHALLSTGAAWIPPVFAALVCGLQLTFWESATAASVDAFNLLLFAYVVNCLLEYRIDGKESRLYRMAFVYGLGITTNWGMIGLLPVLLVALIWIQKRRFLNGGYLLRMLACGLLGLALYFFLPFLEKFINGADMSFWQLMKTQLASQKQLLLGFPKYIILICCFSSILPVFLIGFRLPSSFGDTSVVGSVLTHFMYRFIQAALLVFCIYVAFDPVVSPRRLAFGWAFLPAYYLGALSIGYFSGYFLLICGVEPQTKFQRISPGTRFLNRAFFGLVCAAAVGVPVALAIHNYPSIRSTNSSVELSQYASHLVENLPAQGAIVLSDDEYQLFLVEAVAAKRGVKNPHVLVDAWSELPHHSYLNKLAKKYPGKWPDVLKNANVSDPVEPRNLLSLMILLTRSNEVYYLQPHCGYFAEGLMFEPQGLVYSIKPYHANNIDADPITPALASKNLAFWKNLKAEFDATPHQPKTTAKTDAIGEENNSQANFIQNVYSRDVNRLGVELQRVGMLAEAGQCFDWALDFSPDNGIAWVNQKFNLNLRAAAKESQTPKQVEVPPDMVAKIRGKSASWTDRVYECGPFDEPHYCFEVGESWIKVDPNSIAPILIRQPAQQFERAWELNPDNLDAGIYLANLYLKMPMPAKVLEVVDKMESQQAQHPLSLVYQLQLVRLRAWAYTMTKKSDEAIKILLEAQTKNPAVASIPETLAQIYLEREEFTNSLACMEQVVRLDPANITVLNNIAAIDIQLKMFKEAIPVLTKVLQIDPKNLAARMNRAIANLRCGLLDDAEKDYKMALEESPKAKIYTQYFGLADISWQRKDNPKAIEWYQKYLEFLPRNKEGGAMYRDEEVLLRIAIERLKQMGVTNAK